MVITRDHRQIVIQANDSVNMAAVQKVIDYINILEITAQNQGTDEQAAMLAKQVNQSWWSDNKDRLRP